MWPSIGYTLAPIVVMVLVVGVGVEVEVEVEQLQSQMQLVDHGKGQAMVVDRLDRSARRCRDRCAALYRGVLLCLENRAWKSQAL